MKKILSPLVTLVALFIPTQVKAVCPICTVAVAGGLGISRLLGIDDTVTGIWVGGLILSSGLWLADWINKRNWRIPQKELVSIGIFFLLVIPPLYWAGMIGLPGNTFWGIDKLLFGSIAGSGLFMLGVWLDKWLRATNSGKVYIYYQKVILPVFLLSLGSFILYLITN